MWSIKVKRPMLMAVVVAAVGLLVAACGGGVSQKEYDAVKAQVDAKEQELAQLRAQPASAGQAPSATAGGVQGFSAEEKEHGQVEIQLGQLQTAPAAAQPTGWDTQWSQLLGITLMATFDSSGPDAWDVAANPVVYVVTHGPGYSGFLSSETKVPGIAIVNAATREVVTTAHYDTKTAEDNYSENHGVGVSGDGRWMYTQGRFQGRDVMLIINARTLKLDKILASRVHHARAYRDAATGKELVLVDGWGTFYALDPSDDNRVVGAVNPADLLGSGYLGFVDPAGKELWVTLRTAFRRQGHDGGVAVVDLKNWKVTKFINTGDAGVVWITFTNDGKYAFVSGPHESKVAKIEREAGEVVATFSAATIGPYGIHLSMDEKTLIAIGKGEGSNTNRGITVGVLDPVAARPVDTKYTGCLRGDHGILNPLAPNELWISCNSSFETVIFDTDKLEVTGRIPMPDDGSNHTGAFIRYSPGWSAELLSDTNGLHNSFSKEQAELLAKAAASG